jgi:hypothetical protein
MSIQEKAEKIFLQVYEWQNEIDLKGVLPEKNDSIEYLMAKTVSLNIAFQGDLDVYLYIVNHF